VLLLISRGARPRQQTHQAAQLIEKIGQSDVLVLSVSFSPAKAELLHDIKDNGDNRMMSISVSTLAMVVQAFKKNVSKEVAHMSGGEYNTFTGDKGFEKRVVESAQHARNRYLITFSPSDPTPGLHTIRCGWRRTTARGSWRGRIIGRNRSSRNGSLLRFLLAGYLIVA
jgi:hypothetical protein